MPLFEKKTDAEKAAVAAAKDAAAQAEAERRRVEASGAADRQRIFDAALAAHVAQLPKYEYATEVVSRGFLAKDGKFPGSDLDQILNRRGADGWRLAATSMTGKMEMGAMRGDRNDIFLFFERPRVVMSATT